MQFKAACALSLASFLFTSAGSTEAEVISIRFDELDSLARTETPRSRIIDNQFKRTMAERDEDLQWANPELAYDREDFDASDEYQVTVGKQFAMPWAHMKRRSAWNERISGADLMRQARAVEHLSDLKSGYVTVRVHRQYLMRLEQLRGILTDASGVATSRRTEGHLSGVEEHLIQMTVISINAGYQEAMQEQREALAHWQAAMGYGTDDSLVLSSDIAYRSVALSPAKEYLARVESQPGVEARLANQRGLARQASAARASFIPSFNLYGGYKKIDPDYDGYVAGVSLSLPLFNRNGAEARRYDAESDIAAQEALLYRNEAKGRLKALLLSIAESQSMLAGVSEHFEEDLEALNNLFYSYEEGWLSLSELLNAIQIETAGLKDYYEQLIRYYENLFELETLTGSKIVRF